MTRLDRVNSRERKRETEKFDRVPWASRRPDATRRLLRRPCPAVVRVTNTGRDRPITRWFHEFFRARRFIPCKFRETADSSERSGRNLRARADLMPQTAAAVRRSRVWRVQLATGSASALFRQEKRDVRQGMREIAEGWSHLSTYSPFSTH